MQRAQALHQVGLIVAVEAVRVSKERDWRGDTCDGRLRLRRQGSGRPEVEYCWEATDVPVGKTRVRGCCRGGGRWLRGRGGGRREFWLANCSKGLGEVLRREGRKRGRKAVWCVTAVPRGVMKEVFGQPVPVSRRHLATLEHRRAIAEADLRATPFLEAELLPQVGAGRPVFVAEPPVRFRGGALFVLEAIHGGWLTTAAALQRRRRMLA